MPKDRAREGDTDDREIATPGRALERLRAGERESDGQAARRLARAAVEVSGEVGYRRLTVKLILDLGERLGIFGLVVDQRLSLLQEARRILRSRRHAINPRLRPEEIGEVIQQRVRRRLQRVFVAVAIFRSERVIAPF